MLQKIKELHQKQPTQILADKGYASEENYEYLEQQDIDGYIPHPKLQGKLAGNLEGWHYSATKDEYIDPDGNRYYFKQYSGSKTKRGRGRPTSKELIQASDFKSKVYQAKTND